MIHFRPHDKIKSQQAEGGKYNIENFDALDWRAILNSFVQTEITDYSFSLPDRRFSDSDFFLPDYNEETEKVQNVWFLVDTSGSISDKAIRAAYSEIAHAIEQFGGAVQGLLSFTECFVTDPVPFETIDDLLAIKPVGGGSTNCGRLNIDLGFDLCYTRCSKLKLRCFYEDIIFRHRCR